MSAHLGKTKTLEKVRQHAYWPGWKKDVAEYVRCCHICHGGKGSRPWRAGRMQRMPVKDLSGPFSLVVADAIGPLPITDRGNKWAEAFVIQALDSITFVNVMIEGVICRHGVPEQLLSDSGTNFTSE
ncbi:Gag-pol fusion protein, partial [Phytophthora megakarya]